jgi:hypothetical protein
VAIMPNDPHQATAAAPKNIEITSVRIPLQTLLSQTRKTREHMTTAIVRSGKLKRKPFNSNVAGHLLTSGMAVPNQFVGGERYPSESTLKPLTSSAMHVA